MIEYLLDPVSMDISMSMLPLAEAAPLSDAVLRWSTLWFWVLIIGTALFLGIFIYSTIVGARDLKQLFEGLAEDASPPRDDDQS